MIEITDFSSHIYNNLARKKFSVGEGKSLTTHALPIDDSCLQGIPLF